MDIKTIIIVSFAVIAIITGYFAMEWSATSGHWNDAGGNWSR